MAANGLLRKNLITQCKSLCLQVTRRSVATTNSLRKKNELITLEPMEVATGMYKRDILDRLSGTDDPFSVKTMKHGLGTKEQPNMIPSAFESRMIGCICEEDSATIEWMWLQQGEAKKCQCGFWFKLYYEAPLVEKNALELN